MAKAQDDPAGHAFICTACGIQYLSSASPPRSCVICEDERQFVPASGQSWTTLERLRQSHMATFRHDGSILGIGMSPHFAIGQRALLVRTDHGNILWDCISLLSDAIVDLVGGLGGLSMIAISHPHFYATMTEWSRAFGGIPVHLHEADREWVVRPDPNLAFWQGDALEIAPGVTLVRTGGHFEGSAVLHLAGGAGHGGALLTGDSLQVLPDRRHLGFMRSYPNLIPLGARAVGEIAARLSPFDFDAVYGAFWDRVIPKGGREAFDVSIARHIDRTGRG